MCTTLRARVLAQCCFHSWRIEQGIEAGTSLVRTFNNGKPTHSQTIAPDNIPSRLSWTDNGLYVVRKLCQCLTLDCDVAGGWDIDTALNCKSASNQRSLYVERKQADE